MSSFVHTLEILTTFRFRLHRLLPISEDSHSRKLAVSRTSLKTEFSHMVEERIKCVTVMLALACLAAVGISKDIKPSYQVINSDGILGNYTLGADDNTFLMDCTGCFPEGRIISMKIRDVTDKCRGDTSDSKNKSLATIYCRPCYNYHLEVSAKVFIEGLPQRVNRTFKYKKDACPLNLNASHQVSSGIQFHLSVLVGLLSANLHFASMLSVFN